jgi:hypothetical protein
MAHDNLAVAISQDRDIKAEGPDAVGNLLDLLLAVMSRVGGIRFQIFDSTINNR